MTRANMMKLPTVALSMVKADMGAHFGRGAEVGYIAVRNSDGKFYMSAGRAAHHIALQNVGYGDTAYRVIEG